jgi:hypothetical protein
MGHRYFLHSPFHFTVHYYNLVPSILINKSGRIRGRGQKERRREKRKIIIRNGQEGQRPEKIEALTKKQIIVTEVLTLSVAHQLKCQPSISK